MQQIKIHWLQPYEEVPVVERRGADVGIALGAIGLGFLIGASGASEQERTQNDRFPGEYDPTGNYLVGVGLILSGIGYAAYSFTQLPKGSRPAARPNAKRWTTNELVETTGCGAPAESPMPTRTVEARLKELERLRRANILTEPEYRQKREQVLSGI
jgi:hypothetical protein